MNLNKIRVAGLSLLLAIMTSTNCFASSKAQEIKTLEFDKTIAIEDIEQYKSNIENEIMVDGIKYQLSDVREQENKNTITKDNPIKMNPLKIAISFVDVFLLITALLIGFFKSITISLYLSLLIFLIFVHLVSSTISVFSTVGVNSSKLCSFFSSFFLFFVVIIENHLR